MVAGVPPPSWASRRRTPHGSEQEPAAVTGQTGRGGGSGGGRSTGGPPSCSGASSLGSSSEEAHGTDPDDNVTGLQLSSRRLRESHCRRHTNTFFGGGDGSPLRLSESNEPNTPNGLSAWRWHL
eukprot:TRINITY_DN507_c0_g1_i1.p3 TRINITY_DN507_c0_g1~~TRINITY_DN507_c0_g1_i1.p3  ORF type:complete len:124 (+),score=1.01 TRINITY_DN507_c0_g1_i1:437-808(+)